MGSVIKKIAKWGDKYHCPDCGYKEAEITIRIKDARKMLTCPACGKEYVIIDDDSSEADKKMAKLRKLISEIEEGK